MIGLIDCNNFFVSCERVVDPSLEGLPVIVLSANDGCAIARSNEAKALGIKMAVPTFKIEHIIKRHNVVALSANHRLYGELSQKVMESLATLVPEIEVYSIDEAFLNFDGMELFDLKEYGQQVVAKTKEMTGIPTSLGIAETKTLSKIANHFAKRYPNYHNVCIIGTNEQRRKALQLTPIDDVWGVGRRYNARLRRLGITTAWEFAQMSRSATKGLDSIGLQRTWMELNGTPCLEFNPEQEDNKQISRSRSFKEMVTDLPTLSKAVASYAANCAERLRKQHSCAETMVVSIRTNRYRDDLPSYSNSITIKLPVPTNSTIELVQFAREGLRKIYREGYHYKKAGVSIVELSSDEGVQTNMFDTVNRDKHSRVMEVMDQINTKYSYDKLILGTEAREKSDKSSLKKQKERE